MQPRYYLPFLFLYLIVVVFCGVSLVSASSSDSNRSNRDTFKTLENRSEYIRTGESPAICGRDYFWDRYAEAPEPEVKFERVLKRTIGVKFSADIRRECIRGTYAHREKVIIPVLLNAIIRI